MTAVALIQLMKREKESLMLWASFLRGRASVFTCSGCLILSIVSHFAVTNAQRDKQPGCPPSIPNCPTPTPTRTPTRTPSPRPSPSPKMIEERPADFVQLKYGQNIRGTINWRDRKTGANKQSNGQFTLYNDYYFDARRSDDLTIRLSPSPPSLKWAVEVNEIGSSTYKRVIPLKLTRTAGEYRLEDRLPIDGRYHVLVKYTDLDVTATNFSANYHLLVFIATDGRPGPTLSPPPIPPPTPTPTPRPSPTLSAANPAVHVQRCSENLRTGDWAEARRNCKRALDLNGTVIFNIKTPKKCSEQIAVDEFNRFDKETTRQLEIQPGRIEVKENGTLFKNCFDPNKLSSLANFPKVWVFVRIGTPIIEIREFKSRGGKEVEGETYRLFPASVNHLEAELIRELVDTYFINKRR